MKRSIILCFAVWMTAVANTFACTNLIVGKNASADGSTIVSYSADSYGLFGELYHYPAATYPKGTMLKVYEWDTGKYLGEIEQARQTYNVVGNMNEYQVTIGETTFGGRPELTDSTGIIDYGSLIYIGLQRSCCDIPNSILRCFILSDRKSTRLNSSHKHRSRMPSSA